MPRTKKLPRPKKGCRETGPTLRVRRTPSGSLVTFAKFNGTFFSFGPADDPQSRARFAEAKARWEANGRRLIDAIAEQESPVTVSELCERYVQHAETYYRHLDGTPTGHARAIADALRDLREVLGDSPARAVTVQSLKLVRERMVERGLARKLINSRIGIARRAYAWAAEERLVPPAVAAELRVLRHLQAGRSAARETASRRPVAEADVRATLPFLSRQLQALVLAMWWSGMRCGEAVQLRTRDVDMASAVWVFRPRIHKTAWREKVREIALGPEAQAALKPFVQLDQDRYWFRPCDAVAEHLERRAAARKTPRWNSHMRRNAEKRVAAPALPPGERYDTNAIGLALRRACKRAKIEPWTAHQLRHAALTRIRRAFGLESALAVGGHGSVAMTEHYTEEARRERAREIAQKLG